MGASILIIDDDLELCELLSRYLKDHGFEVSTHHSGAGTLEAVLKHQPSAIILDVMLPERNGYDVCKEIRKHSRTPVLMLTARGDVTERVIGLELGADDYLAKPFDPREILARLRSLLRRAEPVSEPSESLVFDDLRIDKKRRAAYVGDKEIELSSTEFEILLLLVSHQGEVLDRETILFHVRGNETENFDRSIDIMVSRLRSKLGDGPKKSRFIKTVWGTGYVFVGKKRQAA